MEMFSVGWLNLSDRLYFSMPTVLRIGRLRFVIWPNDHDPAHVHVFSAEAEAKIELGEPNGHPRLIENRAHEAARFGEGIEGRI